MIFSFFPFPFFPFPTEPPQPPSNRPPGQPSARPPGPPPKEVPKATPGLKAVDPGAIRQCKYKYVYLWLEDGRSYWAWLSYVGRRSVAGYRWIGYRWVTFGTGLDNISEFICY